MSLTDIASIQGGAQVTLGPFFVGTSASGVLNGMVIWNTWQYFTTYGNDPFYLKALVGILLGLSLSAWALANQLLWHFLIFGADHPAKVVALSDIPVASIQYGTTTPSHRSSFASKSNRATATVKRQEILFTSQFFSSAATDIIICGILSYKLRRDQNGFNVRTDMLLGRVLSLSLTSEQAGLTSATAIIVAILYVTMKAHNTAYLAFYNLLPSLFTLSTVHTLNVRAKLKEEWHSFRGTTSGPTPPPSKLRTGTVPYDATSLDGIRVHVSTLRSVEIDREEGESIGLKDVPPARII
ncbi:hypothetical protein BT69DRAFT_1321533 [Atractiella rhizophila]|nr:hypothetical protein BT69DRAFT_1321533 [Atractiella rhizophila]